MDPLASISAAASILGVIQFGGSLLSKVREIHQSASGLTDEHANLDFVCNDLRRKAGNLSDFARDNVQSFPPGEDGQELIDICGKCVSAADGILYSIDRVRVKQQKIESEKPTNGEAINEVQTGERWQERQKRKLKIFRQAVKAVWNKSEGEAAARNLSDLRGQLELHLLATLGKAQLTSSLTNDYRFQALQKANQEVICSVLDNQAAWAKQFESRINTCQENYEEHHNKTYPALLDAIGKISERIPSVEELESAVQCILLDSLHFASITERYEEIAEAHRHTFDWVLGEKDVNDAAWSSFPSWLRSGNGLYWINGKAASGKSTLMRHILDSDRTEETLLGWAAGEKLDIFSFFFWSSGTPEQRSLKGILRSILRQSLRKHPDQLRVVLPDEFDLLYRQRALSQKSADPEDFRWTTKRLQAAFRRLVDTTAPRKLCLFLDGLDEYDGDNAEMARFLMEVSTAPHVKICVSSRPYPEFENIFTFCSSLRLQDLTKDDISAYVGDRLTSDERWVRLNNDQPQRAQKLVEEIVKMANGIFLWVKLVLNSIMKGLEYDDDLEDLTKRLQQLPRGLEQLYSHILGTIDPPFYLEEAAMFFQTLRTVRQARDCASIETGGEEWFNGVLSLATLALADRKNTSTMGQYAVPSEKDLISACQRTEKRLKSRCMGLLEVAGTPERSYPNYSVSYIHRTFRDFLDLPDILARVESCIKDKKYLPSLRLMQSSIIYLQICLSKCTTSPTPGLWQMVQLSMNYAAMTEGKQIGQLHELLEVLDETMTRHQRLYDTSGYHWSTERLLHPWNAEIRQEDTFLSFCIEHGIFSYVRSKILREPRIIHSANGRQLLQYAVRSITQGPLTVHRGRIIRLLLGSGSSPNTSCPQFSDTSPWANIVMHFYQQCTSMQRFEPALEALWFGTLVDFLTHGADLDVPTEDLGRPYTARQMLEECVFDTKGSEADVLRKFLTRGRAREVVTIQPLGHQSIQLGWRNLDRAHLAARQDERNPLASYGTFEQSELMQPQSVSLQMNLWGLMLCCRGGTS